jgi:hypothetical protein
MKIVRMESWSLVRDGKRYRIDGLVFKHPHIRDGRRLITDFVTNGLSHAQGAPGAVFVTGWGKKEGYGFVLGTPASWYIEKHPKAVSSLRKHLDNRLL